MNVITQCLAAISLLSFASVNAELPTKKTATKVIHHGETSTSAACMQLASDYDFASRTLALNTAESLSDRNAVQSTMREAQNSNVIARARIIFDLIKANHCPVPSSAPSAKPYLSSALRCVAENARARTAALAGAAYQKPGTCNLPGWVADND